MAKNKMKAILKGEMKNISGNKYRQEFIIGKTAEGNEMLRIIYGDSLEHIKKRAEEEFRYRVIDPYSASDISESNNRKRRIRGSGSIYPHNKGRWAARIYVLQEDGRKVQKNFYAGTKEEAASKLNDFIKEYNKKVESGETNGKD